MTREMLVKNFCWIVDTIGGTWEDDAIYDALAASQPLD
jgi:hypothetical protein